MNHAETWLSTSCPSRYLNVFVVIEQQDCTRRTIVLVVTSPIKNFSFFISRIVYYVCKNTTKQIKKINRKKKNHKYNHLRFLLVPVNPSDSVSENTQNIAADLRGALRELKDVIAGKK